MKRQIRPQPMNICEVTSFLPQKRKTDLSDILLQSFHCFEISCLFLIVLIFVKAMYI